MSPASRERDKENPRRGEGKGAATPRRPGRKRERQILGGRDGKREKEQRKRGRQKARIKGKRSKGYLHRVVFFQCFLFEQFVERLSRLIFGMMSMNYILYKIQQRFCLSLSISLSLLSAKARMRFRAHRSFNESRP